MYRTTITACADDDTPIVLREYRAGEVSDWQARDAALIPADHVHASALLQCAQLVAVCTPDGLRFFSEEK